MPGGYSKKFYTGRLRPAEQPFLPFLNHDFFTEKVPHFLFLLINGTPFTYLVQNVMHPF